MLLPRFTESVLLILFSSPKFHCCTLNCLVGSVRRHAVRGEAKITVKILCAFKDHIAYNAEVIQTPCPNTTGVTLTRPTDPHGGILKMGGKVSHQPRIQGVPPCISTSKKPQFSGKLVGKRWDQTALGRQPARARFSNHTHAPNLLCVQFTCIPRDHLSRGNHAEKRIPWPIGPTELSLQGKLDYSSDSRIR